MLSFLLTFAAASGREKFGVFALGTAAAGEVGLTSVGSKLA